MDEEKQELPVEIEPWRLAAARAAAEVVINASGLPEISRARLTEHDWKSPEELSVAIESERQYIAALNTSNVVQLPGGAPRSQQVTMRNSLDRLTEALESLMLGRRPANAAPLSGLREFYHLLSGDYEMAGVFHPDRVELASVNSSTMASMVANVLNKMLAIEFMQYPQWWTPIVREEEFTSLQNVSWITLGGVGELPTVAEGAAYTELTWDDKAETSTFVKKGGYLGITLEAIDKDDVGRLRAAPRALAQAAYMTLGKTVSAIFTANSGIGPTLADTGALFNSTAVTSTGGHANLGTAALSITTWAAARLAMRKQVELNSGERLGALTTPKYLLVPPDLEVTALQVLGTDKDYLYALSNGVAGPENVFADGDGRAARMASAQSRVIVVDFWTDANDWAAVADPRMYPGIGIGYRYGKTPEIFSVASPTAGLMFTNDTLPVKVRFYFAVGAIDFRGLYKANV